MGLMGILSNNLFDGKLFSAFDMLSEPDQAEASSP
jgi:hypothetical protein